MVPAELHGVKAAKVEDLLVWQRAKDFVAAVSAILARDTMKRDRPLSNQLNASSISTQDNIAEGFGQGSDRAFARYLYVSRGATHEATGQLATALTRGHISKDEFELARRMAEEVGRMLTGLIHYLHESDRKVRR